MHLNRYVFNHVPKTGGISFLAMCRQNLAASEISPHLSEDDLASSATLEQYRLIAGHFSLLAQARISEGRYSMTLLRDPIQAILSTYSFWRAALEATPLTNKAKELSFSDFVSYFADAPSVIYNRFTHHFAAIERDCPGYAGSQSSLLAAAKRNLAMFDFVGICEQFERSARLLCRNLMWQLPAAIPHENRSRPNGQGLEIDDRTMRVLRDRNELDLELYAYAVSLFEEHESDRSRLLRQNPPPVAARATQRNHFVSFSEVSESHRKARIDSASATWLSSNPSTRLQLMVEFHASVSCDELIVGAAVKNSHGQFVWGTNTLIEKLSIKIDKGSRGRVTFVLRFVVPKGRYFVTVALNELRRAGFHDHWVDQAASFDVVEGSNRYSSAHGIELLEIQSVIDRSAPS